MVEEVHRYAVAAAIVVVLLVQRLVHVTDQVQNPKQSDAAVGIGASLVAQDGDLLLQRLDHASLGAVLAFGAALQREGNVPVVPRAGRGIHHAMIVGPGGPEGHRIQVQVAAVAVRVVAILEGQQPLHLGQDLGAMLRVELLELLVGDQGHNLMAGAAPRPGGRCGCGRGMRAAARKNSLRMGTPELDQGHCITGGGGAEMRRKKNGDVYWNVVDESKICTHLSLDLLGLASSPGYLWGEGGSWDLRSAGETVPGCASFLCSLIDTVLRSDPWSLGPELDWGGWRRGLWFDTLVRFYHIIFVCQDNFVPAITGRGCEASYPPQVFRYCSIVCR